MRTATVRLSEAALGALPAAVATPRYDRRAVGHAVVHIGVGGFHRAHQAAYLDELLSTGGDPQWGVCGVGVMPQDRATSEALASQDFLYTLVTRDESDESARVVGSLREYLFAPNRSSDVLARLESPETRVVTMTITEGGYFRDEGSGELQGGHPDLRHDAADPSRPRTVFGYLAEALDRRRRAGIPPFTILSCDNLEQNGVVAKRTLTAFAALRDERLARWIEENVAFPGSMVDRITPATTANHIAYVREFLGIEDAWPVMAESFRQWVVEDRFCNGRPALEDVGVLFTSDVLPYEQAKIRLLNGGHQALAHAGLLLGHSTADGAMRDPDLSAFVECYMDSVRPLLRQPAGIELHDYERTLLRRFGNPAIQDQLARIACEASARIPKFVLPPLRDAFAAGLGVEAFAFVIASWIVALRRGPETADAIRDRLVWIASSVAEFMGAGELFGALGSEAPVLESVSSAVRDIEENGCRAALRTLLTARGGG